MGQFIELFPFILAGIGLVSLIVATIARIVSPNKRQSKIRRVFTIIGFASLFVAASITAWTIMTSVGAKS